jgi:uncharacterized protein YegL
MITKYTFTNEFNGLDIEKWFGEFPTPMHVTDFDVSRKGLVDRVKNMLFNFALMFTDNKGIKISFVNEGSSVTFDSSLLRLSVQPLTYPLPVYERIACFFGQFIHEAGHCKFTNVEAEKILKKYGKKLDATNLLALFGNNKIVQQLTNIFEDKRIEHLMSVEYPGYNRYLQAARKAIITQALLKEEEILPTSKNEALMFYITNKTLFPIFFEKKPLAEAHAKSYLTEEEIEIVDRAINRDFDTYDQILTVSKQIAKLFDYADDSTLSQTGVNLKQFNSEDFEKTHTPQEIAEVINAVMSGEFQEEFKEEASGECKDIRKESTKVEHVCKQPAGMKMYDDITLMAPKVRVKPSGEHKDLARRLRVSFSVFDAQMQKARIMYEQQEGELDEDELYAAGRSKDIFYDEEQIPDSSMEIILLVDQSGSMSGSRIRQQAVLSNAICEAFNKNPKIKFQMYGHTANYDSRHRGLVIIPYVTPNHKYNPDEVASMEALSNNADGYALEYVFSKFSKSKANNKLVLMLSDGYPSASCYGGSFATQHVKDACKYAESHGITVLSVAIGNFNQEELYKHIIPYSGPQVGNEISKWIIKHFNSKAAKVTF